MKKITLDYWEVEELAKKVLELNEAAALEEIEETLYNEFGISFEQFQQVVESLIIFTPIVKSELTGRCSHAFVEYIKHPKATACEAIIDVPFE